MNSRVHTAHTEQYTQYNTYSTIQNTPTVHRTALLSLHVDFSTSHTFHLVFGVVIDNQFFYETIDSVQLKIWRQIGACEQNTHTCTQIHKNQTYVVKPTVGPLYKGHIGTSKFVHCREVVHSSEVKNVLTL